jgi:hypothetical protein
VGPAWIAPPPLSVSLAMTDAENHVNVLGTLIFISNKKRRDKDIEIETEI